MSGTVQPPYNRFQHASTNTAPAPAPGPVVTPIPLSRSGTGAEVLQALRVSGESGALRPRRDSMDSFNSLHRFTERGTNGVSPHGQNNDAVVPASRTAQPGIPRPSSSSSGPQPKNVWASAHFTYRGTGTGIQSADPLLSGSSSAPLVNVTGSQNVPNIGSGDYRLNNDVIVDLNSSSPIAPDAGAADPSFRPVPTSHREDEVRMSNGVTPYADNPPSPYASAQYYDSSPEMAQQHQAITEDRDEWLSQERRLVERRNAPLGTDPHRPVGGVSTMLRNLSSLPPRIPAINESVEVLPGPPVEMARPAMARALPLPPAPQPRTVPVPPVRQSGGAAVVQDAPHEQYVVTREVVVAAVTSDAPDHEDHDHDHDGGEEENAGDISETSRCMSSEEPSALPPSPPQQQQQQQHSVNDSHASTTTTTADADDEASLPQRAAIPAERRRASYMEQTQGDQAGESARRASVPSIRSMPITREVQLDELDPLVPQVHPPVPPSTTSPGTSTRASSHRSSLALRQSNPVVAPAAAAPAPAVRTSASGPVRVLHTPVIPHVRSPTPLTASSRPTPSATPERSSGSVHYVPPSRDGVARLTPHVQPPRVTSDRASSPSAMSSVSERMVPSRTAGAAARTASAGSAPASAPQPKPQPQARLGPQKVSSVRPSTASSIAAPTYTSAGAPQLNGSDRNGKRVAPVPPRSAPPRTAVPSPHPADATRVYHGTAHDNDNNNDDDRLSSASGSQRGRGARPANTIGVPVDQVVVLAPQDHIPGAFHAPLPAPPLMDAMVPYTGGGGGGDVMHFQPRMALYGERDTTGPACVPGTVKLSTTTLSVEERKVRYLPLDQPFDPDAPDATDAKGVMPMADTFALLHPSDYARVLLANQPTVLALTQDGEAQEQAQDGTVQPAYMANNGNRWVRRSNRAPVATTRDPAGRAPEEDRRLARPALTAREARAQAAQAPYPAFPAYQVTNTMTNQSTLLRQANHNNGGQPAPVESAHDAAGGFLLQRHVQQIATGKLLNGTPSQMPASSATRPMAASVPTSAGSRSETSTPSSTRSAPIYRIPTMGSQGVVVTPAVRGAGARDGAYSNTRHVPTMQGSAEDTRGPAAMTEKMPAIQGYAHSGTRPPVTAAAATPFRFRPNAARTYDLPRPTAASGPAVAAAPAAPSTVPPSHASSASSAASRPTSQTSSTSSHPTSEAHGSRPASQAPSQASSRPTSQTAQSALASVPGSKPSSRPASQMAPASAPAPSGSKPSSRPGSQPPMQQLSMATGRPTSTLTNKSTPQVPSAASSASRGSQPAAAVASVSSSSGARSATPKVRAASNGPDNKTPATIGKPAQQPTGRPAASQPPVHRPSPSPVSVPASSPSMPSASNPSMPSASNHSGTLTRGTTEPTYMKPQPKPVAIARDTRPMRMPLPSAPPAAPPPPPPPAPAAGVKRRLGDYAQPTNVASVGSGSTNSSPHVAPPHEPPHAGLPPPPPPPPAGHAHDNWEEAPLDVRETSLASRSLTHSASPRREDMMSDGSYVSDGDPVTEVQNHTMAAAPPPPPHGHGWNEFAVHHEDDEFHPENRYGSDSPSLVQPSVESAEPSAWHGVVSVPTMRTNSAPPVTSPPSQHEMSANGTTMPREGSEMAVFTPVDGMTRVPISQAERLLSSTTAHHSTHTYSTTEGSQHGESGRYMSHNLMEPSSADTLPIAVSERGEEDEEEDLTKKVRPTVLIVDGEVYELPRHESEEQYFVPDDEGEVYFDEQNQQFYPVEDDEMRHGDEEDEYDEL